VRAPTRPPPIILVGYNSRSSYNAPRVVRYYIYDTRQRVRYNIIIIAGSPALPRRQRNRQSSLYPYSDRRAEHLFHIDYYLTTSHVPG